MTDEELGKRIWDLTDSPLNTWEPLGRAARTLLAARPEVTREAVEEWYLKTYNYKPPAVTIDDNMALLFHFATAREARQIDGMSVEECVELAKKIWLQHNGKMTSAISEIGATFHRLAQPVPVVDPDAEAKKIAQLFANATGLGSRIDKWDMMSEGLRNGWRAVAAAKREAGREDHE